MSGEVPHRRPEIADFDDMLSGKPVSASTWVTLAKAANWISGRGGMCVPWCAVGHDVSSGSSATLNFRFTPKKSAVARVWRINMLASADGTSATVTINGTAHPVVYPATTRDDRWAAHEFVEVFSSKKTGVTTSTVQVAATGGTVTIESIGAYEQVRRILDADTADYGVDDLTMRARQPIVDFDYASIAGVCDAEKNLQARRITHFAWAVPTAAAVSPGSTTLQQLFQDVPVQAAHESGTTTENHAVLVYSKVDTGTGQLRVSAAQAANTTTVSITRTSYGWDAGTIEIETEDLTAANGQRSGEELLTIEAADPTGGTLSIASILIVRGGSQKV